MTNQEIMAFAREKLRGNWKPVVVITLVYLIITCALCALRAVGNIISLIITGPIIVGLNIFFLSLIRNKKKPSHHVA